jgi:hypothetical protein
MTLTTRFSSQQLPSPRLHFDYALRIQVSDMPFDGFRRWGPYDKNQPRKTQIRCAIMYPTWATNEARKLREAFLNGMSNFKGFSTFSRGITIAEFEEFPLEIPQDLPIPEQARMYREATAPFEEDAKWDLVFAAIPYTPRYVYDSPYYSVKLTLSTLGIPCQLATVEKLRSDETFKWSLANIALQAYAKLANVPWVVEAPDHPRDLILGVGRREVKAGRLGPSRRFMGYTTAYRNNGAFLTFNGIVPTDTQDDYCQQLSRAVSVALSTFRDTQQKQNLPPGNPDRIVFHSFKKVSHEEIEALETGIKLATLDGTCIPYALVHIDQSANYLLFDSGHRSLLPPSGYCVTLGPLQRLLLTEGRERYERRKRGFPTPLFVRLDPRSKLDENNLDEVAFGLTEQVHRLSKVNWRGFNAATIPITLGYSRLIADIIASCPDSEVWARIASAENLRNRAWFL